MKKTEGWSKVAIPVKKPWDDLDRPKGWQGALFGLVLHTTGSGLPAKAKEASMSPLVRAVNYYTKEHGTHYVCGWRGLDGDLLQVANEREQAHGVGTGDQRASNKTGWRKDLPPSMVKRWESRWGHLEANNPLELFPNKYVNSSYCHLEMIPCVFHYKNKLHTAAEPMAPGLRFTKDQHDAVVALTLDVAERNGWPIDTDTSPGWWESGRFVGHEDVSPITRHVKAGGWDPGLMRAKPWFDWDYVIDKILVDIRKKEIVTTLTKQLSSYKTINEVRGELDLPDIPYGDIPLNPTYLKKLQVSAPSGLSLIIWWLKFKILKLFGR